MAGWSSLPWLWSLAQPTLVLMGSDDPLVLPINGQIMARLIPNAELRMIDDGHLFMVTKPAETAALIEEFLADERSDHGASIDRRCREDHSGPHGEL
jgi:pimeloyl-ACP methyl ester carboxylesterase